MEEVLRNGLERVPRAEREVGGGIVKYRTKIIYRD